MTVDVVLENQVGERESAEMFGARFRDRMNVAVSTVRSGTQAALESYPGKVILSSTALAAIQIGIASWVARGMTGGVVHSAIEVAGGTALVYGAQRFRDVYLQDEAGKERE